MTREQRKAVVAYKQALREALLEQFKDGYSAALWHQVELAWITCVGVSAGVYAVRAGKAVEKCFGVKSETGPQEVGA